MRTTRPDLQARTGLGIWPTPLQSTDNRAGGYVKREDLCGFAFGGSKVRALEALLGEALGRQALHTAPEPGAQAVNAAIAALAGELGPSAYPIPRAGAAAVGVADYRATARELLDQLPVSRAGVVVALGSGGMCAGLLLGSAEASRSGTDVRVIGVPVSKTADQAAGAVRGLLGQVRRQQLSQAEPDAVLARLRICVRPDPGRVTVLGSSGGLPAYFDAAERDR